MNPTELALFSANEQTLLVATEPARLALMSEDELGDALLLVRRARNKYSKLHRRQGSATVGEVGRRAATQSQNLRTLRKAEIFEDALARVSRAYATAAKAAATQLKSERLALAKAATATSPAAPKAAKSTAKAAQTKGTTPSGRGVVPARLPPQPPQQPRRHVHRLGLRLPQRPGERGGGRRKRRGGVGGAGWVERGITRDEEERDPLLPIIVW